MPHLLLTSALLIALLAIVGIAIGASLRIARDLLLDGTHDDEHREGPAANAPGPISVGEDFRVGLRHATTFAARESFPRDRSRNDRI
jgi:hypothetical protein